MTAEPDLLPLPEMDIYALGSGVGLRDVRHTPVGFSQKKMSEYARANVEHAVAPLQAEIEALRAEVDEWKDVARCASEQQDSLFREARALSDRADKLRAEVERANGWNERVSVCRDHVADIVDGPCVICALDAAEARAERLAEALRHLRNHTSVNSHQIELIDTALHPTAAQEAGRE